MDNRFPSRQEAVLTDILEREAARQPDKPFALFEDETWTYAQTAAKTWSMGAGLVGLGVQSGEYVLSWLPTGKHAIQTWFGTVAAGGVYTPLNTSYRGAILDRAMNLGRSPVLIAHADLVERLAGLDLPHLRQVVVVGGDGGELDLNAVLPGVRVSRFDDVASAAPNRPVLEKAREPWDDMAVIFTSGTTGASKGVRCSFMHHYTYGTNLFPPELGADDRYYLCLPLYHAAATNATYTFLRRGASIAVVESFSTTRFWDDVRRFNATASNLATAMATFLHKQPARADDATNPLRMAYMGPLMEDTAGFCKRFGIQGFTCYASTEVPSPILTGLIDSYTRSVGSLRGEGFEVRVVDEHDREVPVGTVGELIVRHDTPWVMFSGYLAMPEQTAEAWRNGWFHTGDAVSQQADGTFQFADRIRDTIRRRAENISSVEVEAEIVSHPAVLETAVIAVPSEFEEDEVMAYVVVRPGERLELPDLVNHLVLRLPYFMVPRYFEVVNELPKTPTFKVQKYELRKRGIGQSTWDRERAGLRLRREAFR